VTLSAVQMDILGVSLGSWEMPTRDADTKTKRHDDPPVIYPLWFIQDTAGLLLKLCPMVDYH